MDHDDDSSSGGSGSPTDAHRLLESGDDASDRDAGCLGHRRRPPADASTWQTFVFRATQAVRYRSTRRFVMVSSCVVVVLILGTLLYRSPGIEKRKLWISLAKSDAVCDGDHYAWVPEEMREEIPAFKAAFAQAPAAENRFGTGLFHQFGLFTAVRRLKPKYIIESGARHGLGTYILREAAPDAKIFVISPRTPEISRDIKLDSVYYTDEKFQDFNTIDWTNDVDIVPNETLIFFDDHQSGVRRSIEAHKHGFRHIIFDDNEIFSDNYNPVQYCKLPQLIDIVDKRFEGVKILDNYAKETISYEEKQYFDAQMHSILCLVEQLPPLFDGNFDRYKWKYAPEALKRGDIEGVLDVEVKPEPLMSVQEGQEAFKDVIDGHVPGLYNYMAFVKLCD